VMEEVVQLRDEQGLAFVKGLRAYPFGDLPLEALERALQSRPPLEAGEDQLVRLRIASRIDGEDIRVIVEENAGLLSQPVEVLPRRGSPGKSERPDPAAPRRTVNSIPSGLCG